MDCSRDTGVKNLPCRNLRTVTVDRGEAEKTKIWSMVIVVDGEGRREKTRAGKR